MTTLNPIFVRQIKELGIEENNRLADTLTGTAPSVSIRFNKRKNKCADSELVTSEAVPWLSDSGFYLDERPAFTFIPQMHQGLFYVQDASSMFIAHVIKQLVSPGNPVKYLDACAAPGGKTTAAIDALPDGSLITANEYDFRRASILAENVIKWGYPGTIVSRGDTRKFRKLRDEFDIIAADVPCSGEGMFRKDEEAVNQWSPNLVNECAERQKEIIDNIWHSLRAGGYFIYSTCTFNRQENEDMVNHILAEYDAQSVEIIINPDWGIVKSPLLPEGVFGYRFIPGRIRGEGLFMAVFKKEGEYTLKKEKESKKKVKTKSDAICTEVANRIVNPGNYELIGTKEKITAFPVAYSNDLKRLAQHLDIIHYGIPLATVKGKDFIPEQALACSTEINRKSFPSIDVNRDSALQYLRREAITLQEGTPKGYVLITYCNIPLGFVKNIGNRANNLYPEQWRILKKI